MGASFWILGRYSCFPWLAMWHGSLTRLFVASCCVPVGVGGLFCHYAFVVTWNVELVVLYQVPISLYVSVCHVLVLVLDLWLFGAMY